jgi:hypothetical protein
MKRQRGRGRKSNGQQNRNFESNGPDIKIRGSASHVYEKYQQLARDAASSGDRVAAESYLQHAEHYFRVMRSQQQFQQRDRGEDGVMREANGGGYPGGYANGRDDADEIDLGADFPSPAIGGPGGGPLDVVDLEGAEPQHHPQPGHAGQSAQSAGQSSHEPRERDREEGRQRRPRRQRRRYEGGGNGGNNNGASAEGGGTNGGEPASVASPLDGAQS